MDTLDKKGKIKKKIQKKKLKPPENTFYTHLNKNMQTKHSRNRRNTMYYI